MNDDLPAFTAEKLRIDRDDLDTEIMEQPQLFCGVARRYAIALSQRDAAKEAVGVARAAAYYVVRQQIEAAGIKATEAAIAVQIESNKEYRAAMDQYGLLKLAADQLLAEKEAWQQRSYALKDLAALWIAGYCGVSSVKGKASQSLREIEHQENRNQLARQRKRLNDE